MNTIKILVEGYANKNADGSFNASPSSILVESNGKKVIIDPGANDKLFLKNLAAENLTVDDIDIVFLTHYHPDHFLNIRLFPNHPIYDGETIYESDLETFFADKIPGTEIEVIPTPGHAHEHVALKVEVDGEIYVIAQDVFWWMDGEQNSDTEEELMRLQDPFMKDEQALMKSRQKVLEIADWIIPGHGKIFKNPKKK